MERENIKIVCFLVVFFIFFIFYVWLSIKKYIKNKKILKIGSIGEGRVQKKLKNLNKKKYYVFDDVMMRHPNKITAQIDHLVISRKGIFVIETKNYSGVIYGDLNGKYWTHISGKNKHLVYNIVYQNQGHIKCIKSNIKDILLKELKEKQINKFFMSLILFNNCDVKLKRPLFYRRDFRICDLNNLIKNIKKRRRFNIISRSLCEELIEKIKENNISSKKVLKDHVYRLKKINKR